jgi:hypothetical protein
MEGSGRGLIEIISRHLPGGTRDNNENPQSAAGPPAGIRSEYLLSTSLECHRYNSQLGT